TGFSFGYKNVSVSPGQYSGTFAFAPGDGTLYVGITGLPILGDFGLGVSTNGYLPFTPSKMPDGAHDPNIYGQYYVRTQVSLEHAGPAVALTGNMVLDLDANDDGKVLGGSLSKTRIENALSTFGQTVTHPEKLLSGALKTVFGDTAIGFNGALDLTFHGI